MADPSISLSKQRQLAMRMKELGIREHDIVERFILGSGRGGQKINKTASCVQLKHIPSGIQVKCQKERSRAMNRFLARRRLCDRYEERLLGEKSAKQQAIEKIRRQKRRRTRRQKERMLREKHARSEQKELRKNVVIDDN